MQSLLLLTVAIFMLAVPGTGAALAVCRPGELPAVTRLAAVFGFGYATCAGCAFILSAAHVLRLGFFLLSVLAVSVALWVCALRQVSLRDHIRGLAADIFRERLPLLLGALVIVAFLIVHLKFLHVLDAPRYVYSLNGLEIANDGGVPSSTLEYGQSWPLATDKILLDSFIAALILFIHNIAVEPGVLLLVSMAGTALGLWATAWELGLRRTAPLLPLLILSNEVIFNTVNAHNGAKLNLLATNFTEYRAEDFGLAIAYCALALGLNAIRSRRWSLAAAAGIALAAASGTHLIPVLVAAIAFSAAGAVALLRAGGNRARLAILRQGTVFAGAGVVLGGLVRFFAGGAFGLEGASDPSGYAAIHTSFDPTAYLFTGAFRPRTRPGGGHWYLPPVQVVRDLMAGTGALWSLGALLLIFAGLALAALLLFLRAPAGVRDTGVIGCLLLAGLLGIALAFSYHYDVWLEATFGVRRLRDFSSLPVVLVGLGALEALLGCLGRRRPRLAVTAAGAAVIVACAWIVPVSAASRLGPVSHQRTVAVDWLRSHTPCNARILSNQRTEGTYTSLTGRFALLEGMGPFLRVDKLPYVVSLFLDARQFFESPLSHEAFLRQHGISYVVVARGQEIMGYGGLTGKVNMHDIRAAPFLHQVLATRSITIYQVQGAHPPAVSPLLKGQYLHCLTAPVHF
jgi:hypothetical protein